MPATSFKFGDRVVHAARPEWGAGVVTAAMNVSEGGQSFQRLTIRFEREGLKTVSTDQADLRAADDEPPPAAAASRAPSHDEGAPAAAVADGGWLARLEAGDLAEAMAQLPESTRDPFVTPAQRMKATLALYRFSTQGAALLDWAAMQTGLKDPLTRFNRHELEQFFRRFANERDQHLRRLVHESKRQPSAEIERLVAEAPSAAREALRKPYLGR